MKPFKPQTKRFALVPVEPGNEKDTDLEMRQDEEGDVIRMWPRKSYLYLEHDAAIIAALGFPTEGEEAAFRDGHDDLYQEERRDSRC